MKQGPDDGSGFGLAVMLVVLVIAIEAVSLFVGVELGSLRGCHGERKSRLKSRHCESKSVVVEYLYQDTPSLCDYSGLFFQNYCCFGCARGKTWQCPYSWRESNTSVDTSCVSVLRIGEMAIVQEQGFGAQFDPASVVDFGHDIQAAK